MSKADQKDGRLDRIDLALLIRDEHALRRRIFTARESVATTRTEILRAAERRYARIPSREQVTSQLFAMPAIIDFGDLSTHARREVTLLGQDPVWAAAIQRIWRSAFDSEVLDVQPVPSIVHLNAVLGISPCTVHEQAFRGASLFEGRQPGWVPMCRDGHKYEIGDGPRAVVYLLLAYVASRACDTPLASGAPPCDRSSEDLLSAWFAVKECGPSVRVLQPKRFYDALDDAQAAQLHHFMRWAASKDYPHRLDLQSDPDQSDRVTIAGRYWRLGNAPWEEVRWSYDGSWRGVFDFAKVARLGSTLGTFPQNLPERELLASRIGKSAFDLH